MTTRTRLPLPPQATDSTSPEFLIAAEEYVRRVRDSYDKRASGHRRWYRTSGLAVIAGGASLPLLTSLDYAHKNLVISLVGVFVSGVTAVRAFYRWDQMWALLRATEFSISTAYWKWRGVVGNVRGADGEGVSRESHEATVHLLSEVAEIQSNEAISYFKDLPFPQKE